VFRREVRDGLHRNRMNVVVPPGLKEGPRVRPVGLVSPHVPMHVMGRQQPHDVPAAFKLPCPVVCGPASLEQNRRRRLLSQIRQQPVSRETLLSVHATGSMRDRDLERPGRPTLRDRWQWSYAPSGLLLALATRGRFTVGTMMPHRQEESIPSAAPDGGQSDGVIIRRAGCGRRG